MVAKIAKWMMCVNRQGRFSCFYKCYGPVNARVYTGGGSHTVVTGCTVYLGCDRLLETNIIGFMS